MTRRVSLFDSPFLLGFDEFERALDRVTRNSSDGYPPYNIEQLGDVGLRITIAVAGFDIEDLTVQLENNQLVIRGRKQSEIEDEASVYLHRGIATRQFQRSFVLADDIEVTGARLEKGLLQIELVRIMPEPVVQTIAIEGSTGKGGDTAQAIDVDETGGTDKKEG